MDKKTRETQAAIEPTKRAVLYLRVSSKRQMDTDADFDPDGNSIDTQRKWATQKAKELGVVVVGEYVEPGNSAQTIEKRPVFREMMRRIIEQHDVEYVIIYQRSRAFRNYTDAAVVKRDLRKRGIELASAKENFGEGIMADAMEAVTDIFNEVQVRLSGEDIRVKMANKARNGGTIGRAPVGYLNVRKRLDGREIRTVETDQERKRYIPMAFELMATGTETLESLQQKLTQAGFRMPNTGKPISVEKLRNLLRDRYYLGFVEYDGIEYPGRHEPLITDTELFDRVQRVLDANGEKHVRYRTHNHYLKGLVWCARCNHRFVVMRAEGNGGEYFYFLCRGRQQGLCDMPYLPVEVVEKSRGGVLRPRCRASGRLPRDAAGRGRRSSQQRGRARRHHARAVQRSARQA